MAAQRKKQKRPLSPGAAAWQLLWELSKASKPHVEAIAGEVGLTTLQAWALKMLAGAERPTTMSELAAALVCDASSVTAIVDRLESHRFVERRAAEHDRRVKVLVLTAVGKTAHNRLAARMEQAPPPIANLPVADQRALRDILRRALATIATTGDSAAER